MYISANMGSVKSIGIPSLGDKSMPNKKSKQMKDKPEFLETFQKCSEDLQQLFTEIRDAALSRCQGTDYGYTNKTDFRFSLPKTSNRRWETYAELVLRSRDNNLLCNLRVDNMSIRELQMSVTSVKPQNHSRRPNETLLRFTISSQNQVADTVDLIYQVFHYHLANS